MLDPHICTSLQPVPGSLGTYQVQFRGRDRHGHVRPSVLIVPPRHDEYPRFLSAACSYDTGVINTSFAGDVKGERKQGSKAE
ncbi:uncharacterized protein EDB91DRAFT_1141488 [Suillus paluster]|uniref:uncharacterized protein n=1 Tax=Suillus paluster TaxID=48578 RepID=UPI001B88452C|nr:uncharacterized protein EDB91DRAFT_1141488 [Suillus paluster]KAG1736882.1 hypothetical protein EDB91DRAFT_1141488 [Suillus paluster]